MACSDFQHQKLRRKLKWPRTYQNTAPLGPHMAQLTLLPQPPATAPLICAVARTRLIIVLSQRLIRLGISSGVIGVQRPISSLFISRPGILLAYPIAFYKQTKKTWGLEKWGGMERVGELKVTTLCCRRDKRLLLLHPCTLLMPFAISISTLRPKWGSGARYVEIIPTAKMFIVKT